MTSSAVPFWRTNTCFRRPASWLAALPLVRGCMRGLRLSCRASAWTSLVQTIIRESGLSVLFIQYITEDNSNKAVAEGAVSFFLTNSVATRVARLTYGTKCMTRYDPNDIEHITRQHRSFTRPSGRQVIPDAYRALLTKVSSCYHIKMKRDSHPVRRAPD